MDTPGAYTGGVYKHHISRKEIENMKKNMKKVPVIQLKTEIYHEKEISEADKILKKISQEDPQETLIHTKKAIQLPWYKKILQALHDYFNPSA